MDFCDGELSAWAYFLFLWLSMEWIFTVYLSTGYIVTPVGVDMSESLEAFTQLIHSNTLIQE